MEYLGNVSDFSSEFTFLGHILLSSARFIPDIQTTRSRTMKLWNKERRKKPHEGD